MAKRTVFDAGVGNTFTLSGLVFLNGICLPNKEEEADLIRNYIKQTGEQWQEVDYNEADPRHNRNLQGTSNVVVSGVQTSANMGPATNQLAAAILDGSFTDMAKENADALNVTLLAEQAANVTAETKEVKPASAHLNIKK